MPDNEDKTQREQNITAQIYCTVLYCSIRALYCNVLVLELELV